MTRIIGWSVLKDSNQAFLSLSAALLRRLDARGAVRLSACRAARSRANAAAIGTAATIRKKVITAEWLGKDQNMTAHAAAHSTLKTATTILTRAYPGGTDITRRPRY